MVNKFMVSSMQVVKLLDKSEFKVTRINNLRSNFKTKYVTIEINTFTVQRYNKILAATQSVRICQFSIARK